MTYQQFVQAVERRVREKIGGYTSVSIYTAQKNNGTRRNGLLFSESDSNVSPTIYLEEYYWQFQQGEALDKIVEEILRLYGKIRFREQWREDVLRDFETLKSRIVYRMINRAANQEMLEEVPHVPYLDLAIVFYVLLEICDYGTAAMPVKTEHLKIWRVTAEQIYGYACKNTQRLLPYEFQTMRAVIAELADLEEDNGEDCLFVLTNCLRSFGASAVLYPGCLVEIGKYLGENYYVLPSSVHEMLIVPASAAGGKKALSAMVAEINEMQVPPEEVLSDRAYFYDCSCKELSL